MRKTVVGVSRMASRRLPAIPLCLCRPLPLCRRWCRAVRGACAFLRAAATTTTAHPDTEVAGETSRGRLVDRQGGKRGNDGSYEPRQQQRQRQRQQQRQRQRQQRLLVAVTSATHILHLKVRNRLSVSTCSRSLHLMLLLMVMVMMVML